MFSQYKSRKVFKTARLVLICVKIFLVNIFQKIQNAATMPLIIIVYYDLFIQRYSKICIHLVILSSMWTMWKESKVVDV